MTRISSLRSPVRSPNDMVLRLYQVMSVGHTCIDPRGHARIQMHGQDPTWTKKPDSHCPTFSKECHRLQGTTKLASLVIKNNHIHKREHQCSLWPWFVVVLYMIALLKQSILVNSHIQAQNQAVWVLLFGM